MSATTMGKRSWPVRRDELVADPCQPLRAPADQDDPRAQRAAERVGRARPRPDVGPVMSTVFPASDPSVGAVQSEQTPTDLEADAGEAPDDESPREAVDRSVI